MRHSVSRPVCYDTLTSPRFANVPLVCALFFDSQAFTSALLRGCSQLSLSSCFILSFLAALLFLARAVFAFGWVARWRSRMQFGLRILVDVFAHGLVYLISALVQASRGPHPAWSRRQDSLQWSPRCRAIRTMLAGRFWGLAYLSFTHTMAIWDLWLSHFRALAKGISWNKSDFG